ncbi:Ubiquinone biosynthesis O-methyltransferase, mitochondrial [Baekduia alba]|uniref:class I SAM-dependent methyltransferase n=1 Tax=Baekduia alba TaxID=2997333 RepID=UPI002340CDD8|nr:class I SAM-dependent methyltransferase [Baekduia alba]WCB93569.1 Ubiquinone biosynthesis O-methyltransferase, mitochondrial [Baekduia alba]
MTDDATGWFEPLYAQTAADGGAPPWNRDGPHGLLEQVVEDRRFDGGGTRSAIVVGCGLGADAEYIASKNYNTTAFDLAPTAIRIANDHHPDTRVQYEVADLLDLPDAWRHAFDLVVECWTVQALPDPPRTDAIHAISDLVAPGGTLIVIAVARDDDGDDSAPDGGPPWFLNAATIAKFAHDGVEPVDVRRVPDPEAPEQRRGWRAELTRPAA